MYRVEKEQAYKPCANWDEEMPSGLTAHDGLLQQLAVGEQ